MTPAAIADRQTTAAAVSAAFPAPAPVLRVREDLWVRRDLRDRRVRWDREDLRGLRERRDQWVRGARRVPVGLWELPDRSVRRVLWAQRVPLDRKGLVVLQVLRAQLVLPEPPVQPVRKVP